MGDVLESKLEPTHSGLASRWNPVDPQTTQKTTLENLFRPAVCRMQAYVPGEQPQGGKFIKLNTNENSYPPSRKVVAAIAEAAERGLERYPDPLGTAFRLQAADVLGIDPDWILCGNGSDDILTIVTRAFVGEGDRLRLPYPSYILYRTLAQLQDAAWQEVHFRPDFQLSDEFSQPADKLKLAFLPNPNSPSGTVIGQEAILALADQLPCPLLVDEAYVDFAAEHCLGLVKQNPKIMVSRTLSKSYALAGLRFGFLVAHPSIVSMLRKVKDSYNCDSLSLAAATAAISDVQWLQENKQRILRTRLRMTDALRTLGFQVTDSQANFVWCTRLQPAVQPLYERLKRDKVLVRYMNYPGWGDGLRISVGTDDQIDACLSVLTQAIAEGL
jgi:histidinol-phosphate aminotransferase